MIPKRFVALVFAGVAALVLVGCESTGNLELSEGGSARVAYEQGVAIVQSQKENTVVVRLLTSSVTRNAEGLPAFFVAVYNGSGSEAFNFSTGNITASFGGAVIRIYTAEELASKIKGDSSEEVLGDMALEGVKAGVEGRAMSTYKDRSGATTTMEQMQSSTFRGKMEAGAAGVDETDPMVLMAEKAAGNDLGNELGISASDLSSMSGDSRSDRIMHRMSQGASSEKIKGNDLSQYLLPCAVAPRTSAGGVIKLHAEDIRRGGPLKLVVTVGHESHEFVFRYRESKSALNLPANVSKGDELSDLWKSMAREIGEADARPIAASVVSADGNNVARGVWYMTTEDNEAMKPRETVTRLPSMEQQAGGSSYTPLKTTGPTIKLEPFFVTEGKERALWRYTTIPGYEILSHYRDSDSNEFLKQWDDARDVLHAMIPGEFMASFDVPNIIILNSQEMMSPLSQDILFRNLDSNITGSNTESQHTPNVILFANDRTASLILLDNKSYNRALVEPGSVRVLLEKRIPKLPVWLVTGIMTLYTDMYLAQTGSGEEEGYFDYLIPPFTWISSEETKKIRGNKRAFCGYGQDGEIMNDLFSREPSPESDERRLWNARAALFVRWAFDGNQASRAALWKFAARAASEPVTESLFEECFGRNYHDMVFQLNNYLPFAIEAHIKLRIENPAARSKPEFRNATDIEIARIQGDWERLVLGSVKRDYVDSTSNYIKTVLTQKYNAGARDPRLLAVLGLLECYVDGDVGAKEFLDAAMRDKVAGPEVYFQLARIRYNEVRSGDDGPLSTSDTNYVMEPLETAYMQSPPQHEYYDLAIKVLANSSATLTSQHQNLLEAGLRLFPRDLDLLYNTADVDARHARKDEAVALAVRGLRLSTTDEDRARFSSLKATLH